METDPRKWIQALRASHDDLVARVKRLEPDQLDGGSCCEEWTLAQVLSHLGSGAEIALRGLERSLDAQPPLGREEFGPIWDRWNAMAATDQAAQMIVWDRRHVSVLEGLNDAQLGLVKMSFAGMELDASGVVGLRLGEHALHLWDVAATVDGAAVVLPSSTELLIDRLPMLAGRVGRAGGAGGPRTIDVRTSDPNRRLLLSIGEQVGLTDRGDESVDGVLEIPAEALIRLVYGRLDQAHTPDGIHTEGSADLEELRNVFPGF